MDRSKRIKKGDEAKGRLAIERRASDPEIRGRLRNAQTPILKVLLVEVHFFVREATKSRPEVT